MFKRHYQPSMDWSQIEASAPGRFVLIGDYGDLEDRTAIAVAIDRRLKVTIRPYKEGYIRLNLKDFDHVREWPTTLPLFSMTRLVATYAGTLNYTDSIKRCLSPKLLDKKFYKTSLNVQRSSKTAPGTCDRVNGESNQSIKTSPAGTTSFADNQHHYGDSEQESSSKKQTDIPDTIQEQEASFFHEVNSLDPCEIDPVSQTDSTVLAFFVLYLAIGDSFAGSFRPALDVEIESDITMCRGLGSSTALGVALCGSLLKAFGISAEPSIIIDWAHNVDKFFHKEVTSLHSSVAVNGGYIYYQKDQKDKIKYHGAPHASPLKILLIDTGVRRDPKQVIEVIIKKLSSKSEFISLALSQLNDLATRIWRLMNDPQFKANSISQQLDDAQSILDSLGLNHERMRTIQTIAQRAGFVVKQSQAGETMFLLYDELDERIDEFISDLSAADNFKVDYHEISFDGLRIKATKDGKK
uniref:Mevalonate kinase n=1 Tax=Aceria tosichella TaxID=561515 RepID=A0A6G1S595_9ACAR